MESGEFIDESTNGRLDGIYLLGWTGDYPHPTNFLDFHFSAQNPQFGTPHPEIYEPLEQASQIADPADAASLYAEANNAIKELVPMVPVVHSAAAYAARADLVGVNNPPFGSPIQRLIDPGKDTLVFMKNAEPISLFCQDETDGESLDTCQQIVEGLYRYNVDGNPEPAHVQATLLELTAATVATEIENQLNPDQVFLCGGGTHNTALQLRLQELLPDCVVTSTEKLGIAPDWVEAMTFAWLAKLTAGGEQVGVDICAGVWHTFISLEADTIVYEVKSGPYAPISDKDFAPWAPAPDSVEAGAYLDRLVAMFDSA